MRRDIFKIMAFVIFLGWNLSFVAIAQDLETALKQEGLSMKDFQTITMYYYKDPQPQKLTATLKAILSQNDMINNAQRFNTLAHFYATVARRDSGFLETLKNLEIKYSGVQKEAVQEILRQAQNYSSPNVPNSATDLDYLWAEFCVTGRQEPVKKIISVLGYPETGMNILLVGAAEWSLSANARQHDAVYKIIKNEANSATGKIKTKLEKILQDTTKNKYK